MGMLLARAAFVSRVSALVCAGFAALPAMAQDERPEYQFLEGVEACILGGGDVAATTATLTGYGWTAEVNEEAGLVNFTPANGTDTFVFMSQGIGFCHVESMSLGTDSAAGMLELFLTEDHGVIKTATGADDNGCPTQTLSDGSIVTIMSGGQDPVCTAPDNSALRFEYTTQ